MKTTSPARDPAPRERTGQADRTASSFGAAGDSLAAQDRAPHGPGGCRRKLNGLCPQRLAFFTQDGGLAKRNGTERGAERASSPGSVPAAGAGAAWHRGCPA